MIGRYICLILAVCMLACTGNNKKEVDSKQPSLTESSVGQLLSSAEELVDQEVLLTGTVVHVCRHGGQRMFIVGEDPDERLRITTGGKIAEFDVELEGEIITLRGIMRELIIDDTYLAEWEAEGSGDLGLHDGKHEEGQEEESQSGDQEKIQNIRDEIASSGKDHISDFWVEIIELTSNAEF